MMDKQCSARGGSPPARVDVIAIVTVLALVMTLTVAAAPTGLDSRVRRNDGNEYASCTAGFPLLRE